MDLLALPASSTESAVGEAQSENPQSESAQGESEGGEDTPVVAEEIVRPQAEGQDTPWSAPNYTNQERALGYTPDAFAVPAGMEDRVAFWIDIYTKYSTNQGLLHDSKYVNLVYESIDFSDLSESADLTAREKEKKRRARVKEAKKLVAQRLERLQKVKSPEGLEAEDLRYWQLFNGISDPSKFKEAARRGRLRFQLGQRDRFMEGIYQSGRHLREMEEIFRREGVPLELTRLPFVESSFNLRARSKVGASGIWQFMRSTARAYLHMDNSCDERNDPLRATAAAARKLRNNFEMLRTWPLAVTGYNHGPSGVARLVKKYKTTNLAELTDVRKGRFGFASANFFASFLAAVHVEQSADRYFGPLKRMAELRGVEFRLTRPLSLEKVVAWFEGDQGKAQNFNPHVRGQLWPRGIVQARNFIRVPMSAQGRVESDLNLVASQPIQTDLARDKREAAILVPIDPKAPRVSRPKKESRSKAMAKAEPKPEVKPSTYAVQKGENLESVAKKLGVSMESLLDLNNIPNPQELSEGSVLQLPSR